MENEHDNFTNETQNEQTARRPRSRYFVDTENVGNRYDRVIAELKPGDEVTFFYTDSNGNQGIPLYVLDEVIHKRASLDSVHCHCGINALDFQLVSYLGSVISAHPDDTYVIVSNDGGYDSVVRFWAERGRKTGRIGAGESVKKAGPTRADPPKTETQTKGPSGQGKQTENAKPKTGVKQSDAADVRSKEQCMICYKSKLGQIQIKGDTANRIAEIILKTCTLPPKGRSLQIQNRLRQAFGKKEGLKYYQKTKPVFDSVILKGPYPAA